MCNGPVRVVRNGPRVAVESLHNVNRLDDVLAREERPRSENVAGSPSRRTMMGRGGVERSLRS